MSGRELMVGERPLSALRVVDLKEELDKRGLSKSGSKKDLAERLKVHLQIEKHREGASRDEEQLPNISMQEKLAEQNPFIRDYFASQAELYHSQKVVKKLYEEETRKESEASSASADEGCDSPIKEKKIVSSSERSKVRKLVQQFETQSKEKDEDVQRTSKVAKSEELAKPQEAVSQEPSTVEVGHSERRLTRGRSTEGLKSRESRRVSGDKSPVKEKLSSTKNIVDDSKILSKDMKLREVETLSVDVPKDSGKEKPVPKEKLEVETKEQENVANVALDLSVGDVSKELPKSLIITRQSKSEKSLTKENTLLPPETQELHKKMVGENVISEESIKNQTIPNTEDPGSSSVNAPQLVKVVPHEISSKHSLEQEIDTPGILDNPPAQLKISRAIKQTREEIVYATKSVVRQVYTDKDEVMGKEDQVKSDSVKVAVIQPIQHSKSPEKQVSPSKQKSLEKTTPELKVHEEKDENDKTELEIHANTTEIDMDLNIGNKETKLLVPDTRLDGGKSEGATRSPSVINTTRNSTDTSPSKDRKTTESQESIQHEDKNLKSMESSKEPLNVIGSTKPTVESLKSEDVKLDKTDHSNLDSTVKELVKSPQLGQKSSDRVKDAKLPTTETEPSKSSVFPRKNRESTDVVNTQKDSKLSSQDVQNLEKSCKEVNLSSKDAIQPLESGEKESTKYKEKDAAVSKEKETSQKEKQVTLQKEKEITSTKQKELISHKQKEVTPDKEKEVSAHKVKEVTSNKEREVTPNKEKEVTPHKEKESISYKEKEATSRKEKESLSQKEKDSISRKEKDSISHKEKDSISLKEKDSILHKEKYSTSHREKYSVSHKEKDPTSNKEKHSISYKEKDSISYKEKTTSREEKEIISIKGKTTREAKEIISFKEKTTPREDKEIISFKEKTTPRDEKEIISIKGKTTSRDEREVISFKEKTTPREDKEIISIKGKTTSRDEKEIISFKEKTTPREDNEIISFKEKTTPRDEKEIISIKVKTTSREEEELISAKEKTTSLEQKEIISIKEKTTSLEDKEIISIKENTTQREEKEPSSVRKISLNKSPVIVKRKHSVSVQEPVLQVEDKDENDKAELELHVNTAEIIDVEEPSVTIRGSRISTNKLELNNSSSKLAERSRRFQLSRDKFQPQKKQKRSDSSSSSESRSPSMVTTTRQVSVRTEEMDDEALDYGDEEKTKSEPEKFNWSGRILRLKNKQMIRSKERKWRKDTTRKTVIYMDNDYYQTLYADVKPVAVNELKLDDKSPPRVERKIEIIRKISLEDTEKKDIIPTPVIVEDKPVTRKVSIVPIVDDSEKELTPSRNPPTQFIIVTNLVRPFTLPQLKDLLQRTGNIMDMWVDKIKSTCIAKFETEEEALETRSALHGVQWPATNSKPLHVDYSTEESFEDYKAKDAGESKPTVEKPKVAINHPVREWDLGKRSRSRSPSRIRRRSRSTSRDRNKRVRRSHSPHRRRHSRTPTQDRKGRGADVKDAEPTGKALDELFRKTAATPSIYWLPLTPQQIAEKEDLRRRRMQERERRLAELSKLRPR